MLNTTLCGQLGIEYPILAAGMGPVAGPELAAAVSSAGACGVLGTSALSVRYLGRQIQRLRALTDKPSV